MDYLLNLDGYLLLNYGFFIELYELWKQFFLFYHFAIATSGFGFLFEFSPFFEEGGPVDLPRVLGYIAVT